MKNVENIKKYLLLFLGGALYALGFPHSTLPSLFFLPIIGLTILFYNLDLDELRSKNNIKKIIISLLIYNLGYVLIGYYWIPYTLKEFGNIYLPFNYILGSLFALIINPQIYFFIAFKWAWNKYIRKNDIDFNIPQVAFINAFIMVLLDNFIPQQFPAHPGHAFLQLAPHLGLAPYLGSLVYSLVAYYICFAIINFKNKKYIDAYAISFTVIVLILSFTVKLPYLKHSKVDQTLKIRMVQGNIGNFIKILSEKGDANALRNVYKNFLDLSLKDGKENIDLMIWPETAYPELLKSELMEKSSYYVPQVFKDVILNSNADFLVGGYDKTLSTGDVNFMNEYNTSFFFKKEVTKLGTGVKLFDKYHKMKLIPFGEGLPFGPLNKPLSKILTNVSFFAQGSLYPLFKTKKDISFFTPICYEILFYDFIRKYNNEVLKEYGEKPDVMINLTNDSWYGMTSEPYQHLFLSKWRALEFQIPIARMTNTGISSVIYPDGSESKRTKLFEAETLDHEVKIKRTAVTLFQEFGFGSIFLIFLIYISIISIMSIIYRPPKVDLHE